MRTTYLYVLFLLVVPEHALSQSSDEVSEVTLKRQQSELNERIAETKTNLKNHKYVQEVIHESISSIKGKKYPERISRDVKSLQSVLTKLESRKDKISALTDTDVLQAGRLIDAFDRYLRFNNFGFRFDIGLNDDQFNREEKRIISKILDNSQPSIESIVTLSNISSRNGAEIEIKGKPVFQISQGNLIIEKNLINEFISSMDETVFNSHKNRIADYFSSALNKIELLISSKNKDLEGLIKSYDEVSLKIEGKKEKQTKIDSLIVTFVLPGLALLLILLVLAPRIYSGNEIPKIFFNGLMLEILTVLLLTSTILILGIGGRIESNVLGTLLGGISGYVLGRNRNNIPNKQSQSDA